MKEPGACPIKMLTLGLHLGEADKRRLRVMAHALRIVKDDASQLGQTVSDLQDFIDLFLVFSSSMMASAWSITYCSSRLMAS